MSDRDDFGDLGAGLASRQPDPGQPHEFRDLEAVLLDIVPVPSARTESLTAAVWAGPDIRGLLQAAGIDPLHAEVATLDAAGLSALALRSPGDVQRLADSMCRPGFFGRGVRFGVESDFDGVRSARHDGWTEYVACRADTLLWITVHHEVVNASALTALRRFQTRG